MPFVMMMDIKYIFLFNDDIFITLRRYYTNIGGMLLLYCKYVRICRYDVYMLTMLYN